MSGSASKVTAGKPKTTGAVFSGPTTGATLPTSATESLASAFKDLGFVSQDGVTRSIAKSTTSIKEWGGVTVLVTEDEKTATIKLKLIEYLNENTQAFVHGSGNVSGTAATGMHIEINDDESEEHAIVIDQILKGGVPERMVINRGIISEIGDTVYVGNNAIAYDLTILALVPEGGGNKIDEYIGGEEEAAGESGASGTSGGA